MAKNRFNKTNKSIIAGSLAVMMLFAGTFAYFTDSGIFNKEINAGKLSLDIVPIDEEYTPDFKLMPGENKASIGYNIVNTGAVDADIRERIYVYSTYNNYGIDDKAGELMPVNSENPELALLDSSDMQFSNNHQVLPYGVVYTMDEYSLSAAGEQNREAYLALTKFADNEFANRTVYATIIAEGKQKGSPVWTTLETETIDLTNGMWYAPDGSHNVNVVPGLDADGALGDTGFATINAYVTGIDTNKYVNISLQLGDDPEAVIEGSLSGNKWTNGEYVGFGIDGMYPPEWLDSKITKATVHVYDSIRYDEEIYDYVGEGETTYELTDIQGNAKEYTLRDFLPEEGGTDNYGRLLLDLKDGTLTGSLEVGVNGDTSTSADNYLSNSLDVGISAQVVSGQEYLDDFSNEMQLTFEYSGDPRGMIDSQAYFDGAPMNVTIFNQDYEDTIKLGKPQLIYQVSKGDIYLSEELKINSYTGDASDLTYADLFDESEGKAINIKYEITVNPDKTVDVVVSKDGYYEDGGGMEGEDYMTSMPCEINLNSSFGGNYEVQMETSDGVNWSTLLSTDYQPSITSDMQFMASATLNNINILKDDVPAMATEVTGDAIGAKLNDYRTTHKLVININFTEEYSYTIDAQFVSLG